MIISRRKSLILLGSAIACPAIIRPDIIGAQSINTTGVTMRAKPAGGSPPPSTSVWGDHGTWLSLSTTVNANDTVTSIDNSGFSTARGTLGHDLSTGKHYFELKLITAPGADALFMGLLDANVTNTSTLNSQNLSNGISTYGNDGTTTASGGLLTGVNIGSAIALANGDVLGIAFDSDNGFHYLAKNNTWLLSGVPTSGATGTGHVGAYAISHIYYPQVSIWGLVNGVVQLVTASGSFTYTPPSGYSAWG